MAKEDESKVQSQKSKAEKPEADKLVSALEQKLEQLTADLQRERADFANFRRRSEEERKELFSLAKADVMKHILPVLDNMGRALSGMTSDLKDHAWAKGVIQLSVDADNALRKIGVEKFNSIGEEFDPNLHEAIAHDDSGGEIVVEEYQPGYTLGDPSTGSGQVKVLRHAMVKVGTPTGDRVQDDSTNLKEDK